MRTMILLILAPALLLAQTSPATDQLLANKTALQEQLTACDPATSVDQCAAVKVAYSQAVLAWSQATSATLVANDPKVAEINSTLQATALALAKLARIPELPSTAFFFGFSGAPNGGLNDVAFDIGGAKLVGSSSYLGAVAHLSRATDINTRISTKVQLHYAQRLTTFRGATVFWTMEVGPDFVTSQAAPIPPSTTGLFGTSVGYAIGSGPLVTIPLKKWKATSLGLHAEVTKGSMQSLDWRGGGLLVFGGK